MAAAVSAVTSVLDSGADLLAATREQAVAVLAAVTSSETVRQFLAQESSTVVPHLCHALESGDAASSSSPRWPLGTRGGLVALLGACTAGTPATQAVAACVLRNLAAYSDLLPSFRNESNVPLLLQLVSLGTPRAQELVLLTASSGYMKLFTKDERGIVNTVQLLDPSAGGMVDKAVPVARLARRLTVTTVPEADGSCRCLRVPTEPHGCRGRQHQEVRRVPGQREDVRRVPANMTPILQRNSEFLL
uniref:PAP18 n=1 Tax=Arundo donax TaxID=35708 RepID=A0A0A8XUX1_ARUDO